MLLAKCAACSSKKIIFEKDIKKKKKKKEKRKEKE